MPLEVILFYLFAGLAIASAVLMVVQRNPVTSAIYLIGNFFCLAALYLLLRAQLLAVLQISIYAGAIMVLVVFVIMLLNLGDEAGLRDRINTRTITGIVLVVALVAELLFVLIGAADQLPQALAVSAPSLGTVEMMGKVMFSAYLLPLQITGMLLLAAVVGAVILAKKNI